MTKYEIIYDYDNGYTKEYNCVSYYMGNWDDLQEVIRDMKNNDMISNISASVFVPEDIEDDYVEYYDEDHEYEWEEVLYDGN